MEDIKLNLKINQLSRESVERQVFLLENLLLILEGIYDNGNTGIHLFEKIIPSEKEMKIFVTLLNSNKKNIILDFQRPEKNRAFVYRKFEKTITENFSPHKWNLWREIINIPDFLFSTKGYPKRDPCLSMDGKYRRDIPLNIPYFDLSERSLHDQNLFQATLDNTNFMGSNLDSSDLSGADVSESLFGFQNLEAVFFDNANLRSTWIICAHIGYATENPDRPMSRAATFEHTDFTDSLIIGTDFRFHWLAHAKFESAKMPYIDFRNSNLYHADFTNAYMRGAKLQGADLRNATFVNTNLAGADISGSKIYGVSVWNVNLEGAIQNDLIVTPDGEPIVKVDNLKLAQFVYLILDKSELGKTIETIASKAVLILGRFKPERIAILEAIKDELRKNYLPIIFDFEVTQNRDTTEMIMTLASLARFVIADLSDPNSIPAELMSFVEKLPSVPVQPIFSPIPEHSQEYPMFDHLARYNHVLPIHQYSNQKDLIAALRNTMIKTIEAKVSEVRSKLTLSRKSRK